LPDANAEAVSPPQLKKAKGKLLAQNTTTGPRGSTIDSDVRLGQRLSPRIGAVNSASTQDPFFH